MLKEIILLTGQATQQLALSALLKEHNPKLSFRYAVEASDLLALDPDSLRHSRLLAFTSGVIVPARILNALGHGAYNFHPGPPEYPGWAPAHFALYQGAPTFGATAHVMAERVDAGPIIGVETFPVPENIGVRELEQIAFVRLAHLFWTLSRAMATQIGPLEPLPVRWRGTKSTRQMYISMCEIPADISKQELALRIRAFNDDFRAIYPTITLHGLQFRVTAATVLPCATTTPDPLGEQMRLQTTSDAPSIAMAQA
jgi:methionyl-tRNA formyltransferase